jgi:hypothetical protein
MCWIRQNVLGSFDAYTFYQLKPLAPLPNKPFNDALDQ